VNALFDLVACDLNFVLLFLQLPASQFDLACGVETLVSDRGAFFVKTLGYLRGVILALDKLAFACSELGALTGPIAVIPFFQPSAQVQEPSTVGAHLLLACRYLAAPGSDATKCLRNSFLKQSAFALHGLVGAFCFVAESQELAPLVLQVKGELSLVLVQRLPPLLQTELFFGERCLLGSDRGRLDPQRLLFPLDFRTSRG
jgi:hypothetical protein